MNGQYEVLSPWAEADPVPLRGISPRVKSLDGKTIGLLENLKPAARPILTVLEEKLKDKFPTSKFSWYTLKATHDVEIESDTKAKFEGWLKGIDTVIAAIAD